MQWALPAGVRIPSVSIAGVERSKGKQLAATSLPPQEVGAEEMWVTRAIPTELLSNTKKVVESWKNGDTPCGTQAHDLQIRSSTPCPLGQGGQC